MYRGFWLREARSVVLYEGLRLCGGSVTNHAVRASGSAKEGLHVRGWGGGSELGSYELRSELEVELEPYEFQ